MKRNWILVLSALITTAISIISCGGGGGGGGSEAETAATVSLDVSPREIDTGDRLAIKAQIGDVNANGILLKFRYSSGLRYVPTSANLRVNERVFTLTPGVNRTVPTPSGTAAATVAPAATGGTSSTAETLPDTYLIFFLTQEQFKHPSDDEYKGDFGEVSFQLEGLDEIDDGLVEVDADIDDPTTSNRNEFDLSNPEFSAQDEKSVSVRN